MSYQVIARKYRPKSFEELVGQAHVTQTLLNALRSGRLPHALLFSGARGVGKTSSARIFAKSLRCPNAKDFVPCNTCQTCEEVAHGSHLDVVEIDGASNNGVDAIRELRETVGYMPASGKYKVYIIDEVHMLSTSAFNALLKTLEEPPAHVVFIFATTEPQKIPVTILSRCQRFDFRRIPTRQIVERLESICSAEKVSFEPEALWTIARQAEGALRDSQSLLDQAITFCDGKITNDKVTQVLGLTDRALLVDTLQALVSREPARAVQVIERLYSGGFDASVFVQDLLEQLRHLLVIKINPSEAKSIVDLADSEIETLQQLAAPLTNEDVHLLFDMALKGANDLIRSQNPRVVLEMLLLRMVSAPRVVEISKLLGGGSGSEGKSKATESAPAAAPAAPARPTGGWASQLKSAPTGAIPNMAPVTKPAAVTPPPAEPVAPKRESLYDVAQDPQKNWLKLVERIKAELPTLGARLEYVSLMSLSTQQLKLAAKDTFSQGQLSERGHLSKLQEMIERFWDRKLEIKVEAAKGDSAPMSPKELANKAQEEAQNQLVQEIENDPLVKQAKSVFQTTITSIKEQP